MTRLIPLLPGANLATVVTPETTLPSPRYLCQRCANCCRWPGDVVLEESDILRIAGHLGLTPFDFVNRHTRLRENRTGLSLREKPGGGCEFLDGIDCAINEVKPDQCRGFPNQWNFPGWRKKCEAIEVLDR